MTASIRAMVLGILALGFISQACVANIIPPGVEFVETISLPSGVGRVLADPVRAKVYAITEGGDVLFIDRPTGQIEKTISTGRMLTDLDLSHDGQTLMVLDNVTREYWNQPPVTYVVKYDLSSQTQNDFVVADAPFFHMATGRDGRLLGVQVNQHISVYQIDADTGARLDTTSGGYFGSGSTDWFNVTFVSNHDGTRLYRTEIGTSYIELLSWDTSTDDMLPLPGRRVGSYTTEPIFINSTDTSLYAGDIRVNPDDTSIVLGVFPEMIYAGTGDDQLAFGINSYYNPSNGQQLGAMPEGTAYMTIGESDKYLYALDRSTNELHVMRVTPEPGCAMVLGVGFVMLVGRVRRP